MGDLWLLLSFECTVFTVGVFAALKVSLHSSIAAAFFCRADEFICNNTLCKLHTWVCDGKDDCGDNSDEDADMCGGLRLSLTRIFFEADDAYFIDLCFSISREGKFHCLFIKDLMHLLIYL